MIFLLSILFTVLFVYYTKYQLKNPKTGKWHTKGFLMRGCFFLAFLFPATYLDIFGALILSAITFDIGINLIALDSSKRKIPWYYTGQESWIDRNIGQAKWYIYGILLATFITLKFIL